MTFIIPEPFEIIFIDYDNRDSKKPTYVYEESEKLLATFNKCLQTIHFKYHLEEETLAIQTKVTFERFKNMSTKRYFHDHAEKRIIKYKGKLIKMRINQSILKVRKFMTSLHFETLEIIQVQLKSDFHPIINPNISKKTFKLTDPLEITFISVNNCDARKPTYSSGVTPELQNCISRINTEFNLKGESVCIAEKVIVEKVDLQNTPRLYYPIMGQRIMEYNGKIIQMHTEQDSLIPAKMEVTLEFHTLQIVAFEVVNSPEATPKLIW